MSTESEVAPGLSVVVPPYNEELSIQLPYEPITASLGGAGVADREPRLRAIDFRGNYGRTPAMAVGIAPARGEYYSRYAPPAGNGFQFAMRMH